MQKAPFRTNATDLTLDELLLLDVLFSGGGQLGSLLRENFQATWNWHSHNLDDAELVLTINRLLDRRVLASECHQDATFVRLTESGGKLWSLERCPIWEKYATEGYGETVSGKEYMTVVATSALIRDDFLRLGAPGALRLDNARTRRFEIQKHELISWHHFPCLFVAVAMNITHDVSTDQFALMENLRTLEQERTWWRNVFELQKFVRLGDNAGPQNGV